MLNDIKTKLEYYNQEHLLTFYNELDDSKKKKLLDQINSINFELINDLYKNINTSEKFDNITSMESFKTNEEYISLGLESTKRGEYALVTMAGGQGTRLGFDGPKGCYILGDGINKSLFEIQCDKLKNIYDKCNVYIPWYIMTSNDNDGETIRFFEVNNYFDYPKDKIEFFVQGELPIVDTTGKILLESKSSIKMGANGSGGVFNALEEYGLLDKMKDAGIKWIFIGGIDNVLLPVDDLDLVGFSIKNNYLASSKIILKSCPEEKVGVFCKKNGKPSVIEYIEMTKEMNNLRDSSGNLIYKDSHILCNLFNIDILESIKNKNLDYTGAFKKIDYMGLDGKMVEPDAQSAYKFECFVFDAFSYVDRVGLLQGKRESAFAPIKNATGVDSPETAIKLYKNFYNIK